MNDWPVIWCVHWCFDVIPGIHYLVHWFDTWNSILGVLVWYLEFDYKSFDMIPTWNFMNSTLMIYMEFNNWGFDISGIQHDTRPHRSCYVIRHSLCLAVYTLCTTCIPLLVYNRPYLQCHELAVISFRGRILGAAGHYGKWMLNGLHLMPH